VFKKKAKDYNTVAIAIDPNKYYDAAGADILLALLESNKSIEIRSRHSVTMISIRTYIITSTAVWLKEII